MRRWARDENRLWIGLIAAAFLALVLLAWFQYRWITQISDADRERRQSHLRASVARLTWEFDDEIHRIGRLLVFGRGARPGRELEALAARYSQLPDEGIDIRLVRNLYAGLRDGGAERFYRYLPEKRAFGQITRPAEFTFLDARREGMPWQKPYEFTESGSPVLVTPLMMRRQRHFPPEEARTPPREAGWIFVELDRDFLARQVLPKLVSRNFPPAEDEFAIRVVTAATPAQVVYETDRTLDAGFFAQPDAEMPLLVARFPQLGERPGPPGFPGFERRGGPRGPGMMRLPEAPPPEGWRLLIKHRAGSLEQAVESARRRNLAVSIAILVLLAATLLALLSAVRRAERLARLQLDFVAGVSHELRTPLSVVCAAADNLADGLVGSKEQVRRYGTVIRNDARRLSRMVEQILAFAAARSGRKRYDLQPIDVTEVVRRALADCEPEIRAAGCEVEWKPDDGLPLVPADATALAHCLRNLLDNAATHGCQGKWIGVSARPAESGRNPVVEITVEDRGRGMAPAELKRIFDPFHRGRQAIEDQTRGFGLGLNLAKRIADAHSATLGVESTPGKGTRFTLRLPAAPADCARKEPGPQPGEEIHEPTRAVDRG